uniref:JmjC domain-containing protein n=1 Tax=Panagrellus redivivus TaxID=6233 RepID=A0A7E5A0S8_PANRE
MADSSSEAPSDDRVCSKCHLEDIIDDAATSTLWIQCNSCGNHYHQICVKIEEYKANLIAEYHCCACEPTVGPSTLKKVLLNHRYHFDALDEANLKPQVGTKQWIEEFVNSEASVQSCPLDVMTVYATGHSFHENFNEDKEWRNPIMIKEADGLKMQLPDSEFDIHKLYDLIGGDEVISVIDVYAQRSSKMSFKSFYERWTESPRRRLYNMLSFEFSHTKLMNMVRAPDMMHRLSWVHKFWPEQSLNSDDIVNGDYEADMHLDHVTKRPDVSMFCLLGMGGSYTEFHIDFGGSSVWYHVFQGQKIFYVVKPTEQNLKRFEKWTKNGNRSETWFGDCLPKTDIYRVIINPGETVMIPSGWIHAVYTPVDSMVFGGNFLHDLNVVKQLRVYKIEQSCNYDDNFMFPNFELCHWYAAEALAERLTSATDDPETLPSHIILGLKALHKALVVWNDQSPCHSRFSGVIRTIENGLRKYTKQRKSTPRKRQSATTSSTSTRSAPSKRNKT